MITLDVEQNSEEWLYARLGIPTASEFGRILTDVLGMSEAQITDLRENGVIS